MGDGDKDLKSVGKDNVESGLREVEDPVLDLARGRRNYEELKRKIRGG